MLRIQGEWRRGFLLVARKYSFEGDVEISAAVFFKSKLESGTSLNFSCCCCFLYDHPSCRRKAPGRFIGILFPLLGGGNQRRFRGGGLTSSPLPIILLIKSMVIGTPIDVSIPRHPPYFAVPPPQTIPCPTKKSSKVFFAWCHRLNKFAKLDFIFHVVVAEDFLERFLCSKH